MIVSTAVRQVEQETAMFLDKHLELAINEVQLLRDAVELQGKPQVFFPQIQSHLADLEHWTGALETKLEASLQLFEAAVCAWCG